MTFIKQFRITGILFCFFFCVHSRLTLVKRNQIDSFHIGDGCDSNATVCEKYEADCLGNKCLCNSRSPHFRNPIIERTQDKSYQYGSSYGCITDEMMRLQRLDKAACYFIPKHTSLLPHGPTTVPTSITYDGQRNYDYCNLMKVEVKYPDSNDWFNLTWLNNSYFDFSLQKMEFKWTKSIAELQGSIIMIFLICIYDQKAAQECLQANIEGTWTSKVLISEPAPTSILAETVTTRYPGSTVPTKVYHSEQPRISSPSTKPPSSITSEEHEETSDTWKNVSIALLVVFPVIIFILILFHILQIKRKRREPETVNPTTNSVYDYPNASFYENSNQTTDNHSYNEPADVNQNSHKDPSSANELSHYQSLQHENMEEQNTYQHLVKPI